MSAQRTSVVNIKRWRPYDVYIGRPGPWGNPYVIGRDGTREEVIAPYQEWLEEQPELVKKVREELRDRVLGCFCAPLACHGDILAEIANTAND